jgi:hypothetical protein
MIERFRRFVEDRGGWRAFWEDTLGAVVHETKMQVIFLGVLEGYCEAVGLRLEAGDHLFTQAWLCIVGCATIGLQGNAFHFSLSGFSWTF